MSILFWKWIPMFVISYSIIRDSFELPVSHRYVDCIANFIGKLKSTNINKQFSD